MSFFKKFLGGLGGLGGLSGLGGNARKSDGPGIIAEETYKGYRIAATPIEEGDGQFRLAGIISKEIKGEVKSHQFIRADSFGSADEAAQSTLIKAKQFINEQGKKIFD